MNEHIENKNPRWPLWVFSISSLDFCELSDILTPLLIKLKIMITIEAVQRDAKVNPKQLRSEGRIPAVFYGKGVEATSISISNAQFIKAYREAGESTIVTLSVGGKKHSVLIHDVSRHAVTGNILHVDFLVVPMDKEIEVSVPLSFEGEAGAAKLGANIIKVMHEVTVSALPTNLPHSISVDLSKLGDIDAHITIGDLVLPKNVKIVEGAEEVVAIAAPAQEETEAPAVDMAAIEVEQKGKKEDAA
jgi:large subunit ribosomal protein L25